MTLERFLPGLGGTQRRHLLGDVLAGITVAALAVPQAMAYALVAGVSPELGLWAAALPAVIAALFGSSRFLVTGPTNPIALVVGVSIVAPAVAAGTDPIGLVIATALMSGVMLAGLGALGFGRASRFLSDSVVAGFAVGAGILIALRQVPSVAGLAPAAASTPAFVPSVWPVVGSAADAVLAADRRALLLALAVPAAVLLCRRIDRRIPGPLLALAGAVIAAELAGWLAGPEALATVGALPAGLPPFGVPEVPDLDRLAGPALAISLLATVQSIAAARALASGGDRLDADRELFAQGAANVASAFCGALPVSGSLTRSALARSAGGRTRLTAAVSGVAVLAAVPLLGPWLGRLPLAALAGLVVLSGLDLINPRALRRAAGTRGDGLVLLTTLAAVLWLDLVQAIYAGLFLSLALLVRRSGRLQMQEMVRVEPDGFREIAVDDETGKSPAVALHLEGDLYFAVAPELSDQLSEIGGRGARVLILRLKRARHLDATVIESLRVVFGQLRASGVTVLLCGLTDQMAELLARTDLGRELGPDALLRTGPRLFEGFLRAVTRARELLAPLDDGDIFRTERSQGWFYEI